MSPPQMLDGSINVWNIRGYMLGHPYIQSSTRCMLSDCICIADHHCKAGLQEVLCIWPSCLATLKFYPTASAASMLCILQSTLSNERARSSLSASGLLCSRLTFRASCWTCPLCLRSGVITLPGKQSKSTGCEG